MKPLLPFPTYRLNDDHFSSFSLVSFLKVLVMGQTGLGKNPGPPLAQKHELFEFQFLLYKTGIVYT